MKKHIVVLSGAGMSAESGLKTFRDSNGLWEGHDVMEVASPEGFATNPELVLEFYNQRRRQLLKVKPNQAHFDLSALPPLKTVGASEEELEAHQQWLEKHHDEDQPMMWNQES